MVSPSPEEFISLAMKSMPSLSKGLIMEAFSRKDEIGILQKFGGLKHEKSTM